MFSHQLGVFFNIGRLSRMKNVAVFILGCLSFSFSGQVLATPIINGLPVTGLGASPGTELRYTIDVPAGASNLRFSINAPNGDADLFVSFANAPAGGGSEGGDCAPWEIGSVESCTMSPVQTGVYHVLIQAYETFSNLTLTASFDGGEPPPPPPPPPPVDNELTNGTPKTDLSANNGAELRYTMNVPAGASNLNFSINGSNGDADLFVSFANAPAGGGGMGGDCAPWRPGSVESCTMSPVQTGVYHVLIQAYETFSNLTLTASFDVGEPPPAGGGDTLIITEVGASRYDDDNRWFEIYNASDNGIQLSGYAFKSQSIDSTNTNITKSSHTFSLPNNEIASGAYMIIRGAFPVGIWQGTSSTTHTSQMTTIKDGNLRPYWTANGFIDLIKSSDNSTVDFVRFGTSSQAPTTSAAWNGSSAIGQTTTLGTSLVRSVDRTDTNAAADWSLATYSTPAGKNDVTDCLIDADEDGIPDCAELAGRTYAGMDLNAWGASQGQRDIFIEVDYMQSNDPGIIPRKEALEAVVAAFARRNFAVHFDIGDKFHNAPGINRLNYDLGGGQSVPFQSTIKFKASGGMLTLLDYKNLYMDIRRKQIFHYLLFGSSQKDDGSGGSSGIAEILGNDLLVSLGNWGLRTDTASNTNQVINIQSGTIMHELGHNLNLRHGGNDDVNWKVNYFSIMNYLYQLEGLSTIGDREGDRYNLQYYKNNNNCGNVTRASLTNPRTGHYLSYIIDYSDGTSIDLNENNLNEGEGLGRANSAAIDWNCNGNPFETISKDINLDRTDPNAVEQKSVLTDYDDWSNISLLFQSQWSGDKGSSLNKTMMQNNDDDDDDDDDRRDLLSNDHQELSSEEEPSEEFFRQLRMDD